MVTEAAGYQQQVFTNASQRLAGVITRTGEKNLIVFNPLPYQRTDIVRAAIPAENVVDSVTGEKLSGATIAGRHGYSSSPKTSPPPATRPIHLIGEPRSVVAAADRQSGKQVLPAPIQPRHRRAHQPVRQDARRRTGRNQCPARLQRVPLRIPHPHRRRELRLQWSRMEKADSVSVARGPVADVLTVTGKAEGVRKLKQTVTLYHDLPRVDFAIWMDKAPVQGHVQREQRSRLCRACRSTIPGLHASVTNCPAASSSRTGSKSKAAPPTTTPSAVSPICPTTSTASRSAPSKAASSATASRPPRRCVVRNEHNFKRDRTYPDHTAASTSTC